MKHVVSVFAFLFIAFQAAGQYGNEWIEFDQPYFKIPVGADGLYRISFNALTQAGLNTSPDPKTFQLFHRGVEQAIYVHGEDDGVFDPGDYVEFFGMANDGALDSSLYALASHQPHRHYNLYSDTTSYFFTYGLVDGKRMSRSALSSEGLVPEAHHFSESLLILKESFSSGKDFGNVHQTAFDEGEGWMGAQILQGQLATYVVKGVTDAVTSQGKPILEILLTGRGGMLHNVELYAGPRLLATVSFQGFASHRHMQELEWTDIDASGNLSVRIRVTGANGIDRVSAGYISVVFPQTITMAGLAEKYFSLPGAASGFSFIRIQNAAAGARLFEVTNPADVSAIDAVETGTLDAVVAGNAPRKIFAAAQVRYPASIRRVTFRKINPALHDYVIVTHASLRKPAAGYSDPVRAYAEYRSLEEGGGFDTLVVNVDELYNQFNYGEYSPRAIFQFVRYLASVNKPEYLFLIGKGLDVGYGYGRRPATFPLYRDLVPTAGFPASDMAFTAGLSGVTGVAGVATGRLTAISSAEVAAYLDKVKERDASPFTDLSRKNILHLSGGIEEDEPAAFKGIMQGFAPLAENLYLGGQVQAMSKQSTDIRLVNIAGELNRGLGLITFFGHSAPNTTDFDIGFVTDPVLGYDNKGKYPFLLMNGCDAGSFFLNTTIFGENWVKSANRGAVGFIAHSSYGLLSNLQRYATTFYQVAFADSLFIKKPIGNVQQEVARRYLAAFGSSAIGISQVQQMVLQGDPAVKLFGAEQPDYAIDGQNISITSFGEEPLTSYTDSFRIQIPIRNFGLADKRQIRIEVTREFSEQPPVTYDTIVAGILYSDTISMTIRNEGDEGYGINQFSISVDADDLVGELNENNNTAGFEYFIPLNTTRNLFPYNFSIVRTRQVDLSFQYSDAQSSPREYVIQVDTSRTFDSGFKKEYHITTAVLGKQHVELLNDDSVVYYWRTRIAQPLAIESHDWSLSSFTCIAGGSEGWAQLRFAQFESNATYGLVKDPAFGRLRYEETVTDIAVRTFSASSGRPIDSVSFRINGVEYNLLNLGGACRTNTINMVAFNRNSTRPYAGIYFKWYELLYQYGGRKLLCGREPYVINSFKSNELVTGNQDDLIQYVDNVEAGDSVVLFSMGNAGFSQWPAAAKSKLSEFGIDPAQLAALQDGDPVVIFGRKGAAPGSATIFHAAAPAASLKVNETISGRFSSGNMSSVLIGPAQRWDELVLKYREVEVTDDVSVSVVGIRADGHTDTLKTGLRSNADLTFIDAGVYPHLKIVFRTADDINLTSVQLSGWLVLYEPVAEGLVFFRDSPAQQLLQEGEIYSGRFGFVNVSDKTFPDSLEVEYDLSSRAGPVGMPSVMKISAPLPGDTTLFSVSFNTISKEGLNDATVFVNPRVLKEESYDNNMVILRDHVMVSSDRMKPVIDVTFDGRYPENNEFVSPTPSILIRIRDENRLILKRDTIGVSIFLAKNCTDEHCAFQRVHFSRPDVAWTPAEVDSDFAVSFSPALEEGTYTLRVEAADAKGNVAGTGPYEIDFQVAYSQSVTVIPPYPNPFSAETAFEVAVAGVESSYTYRLQILALSGLRLADLSSGDDGLHIGNNRIIWRGTDRYGRQLPAGVYLYRWSINGGEAPLIHMGKLVIVR